MDNIILKDTCTFSAPSSTPADYDNFEIIGVVLPTYRVCKEGMEENERKRELVSLYNTYRCYYFISLLHKKNK